MIRLEKPEFLHSIWNYSVIGLAKVGPDGSFLIVNNKFCELVEYSESELLKKKFQDITHPDDTADDVSMAEKCLSGHINYYTMTKRYITKTGKVVWIKLKGNLINLEGDAPFFLAQVTPVAFVDSSITQSDLVVASPSVVLKFMKDNWKWFATGAIAVAGFILKLVVDWHHLWDIVNNLVK